MAEKKTASTRSDDTVDDCEPTQRGGGDGKAKALGSAGIGDYERSRTRPTADELGRRAWEATYKNRQKSRRA
jgi:hypothetical protein